MSEEMEKDRFHGEAGEAGWSESEEAMLRQLARDGYKWFETPGKRRVDLTRYLDR